MKMDYQAPEVELITLAAEEAVTEGEGFIDGSVGTGSNNLFPGT